MNELRTIGKENSIPWRVEQDTDFFRQMTHGQTVVMGRATFDSLPAHRRPMPDRINVVLSHSSHYLEKFPEIKVYNCLESCFADLRLATTNTVNRTVWIIGGEAVYRQALEYCQEVFLTIIWNQELGDKFMPEFEDKFFLLRCEADKECAFLHYKRRPQAIAG